MGYRCLIASVLLGIATLGFAAEPAAPAGGFAMSAYEKAAEGLRNNPMAVRLSKLIIPRVEMEETTIRDVLSFLRQEAREADPEKKGFNLFIKASAATLDATVTMDLQEISVLNLLQLLEQTTQLRIVFEPYAVVAMDKEPARQ